jgi:peroxiredoxin
MADSLIVLPSVNSARSLKARKVASSEGWDVKLGVFDSPSHSFFKKLNFLASRLNLGFGLESQRLSLLKPLNRTFCCSFPGLLDNPSLMLEG